MLLPSFEPFNDLEFCREPKSFPRQRRRRRTRPRPSRQLRRRALSSICSPFTAPRPLRSFPPQGLRVRCSFRVQHLTPVVPLPYPFCGAQLGCYFLKEALGPLVILRKGSRISALIAVDDKNVNRVACLTSRLTHPALRITAP